MADTHVTSGFITIGSGLSLVGSGMNVITSVSGNTVSLTPGTTVQLSPAGVWVMSGQVNTSVSGNVVNISGQQVQTSISGNIIQTSISGNAISISGDILVTSFSGNVITTVTQPVSHGPPVVLFGAINIVGQTPVQLPDIATSSGVYLFPRLSNTWFGGISGNAPSFNSGQSPTIIGIPTQGLSYLIPVTNTNQLSVITDALSGQIMYLATSISG